MTDQHRDAAWAAVHRPETSSEELGRIAEAHPEFGAAIQAHPNAPVAGVSAAQYPRSAAPSTDEASQFVHAPGGGSSASNVVAAPGTLGGPAALGSYAATGAYAAPGGYATTDAYAAPGAYPNAGAYPAQQGPSASTAPGGRLNVFGIIALAILVVQALTSVFLPVVISRLAYDLGWSIASSSLFFSIFNLFWIIVGGGFALAGVLQKQATRMRWTAVSALVSCGLGVISLIASLFSGMLAPLFY